LQDHILSNVGDALRASPAIPVTTHSFRGKEEFGNNVLKRKKIFSPQKKVTKYPLMTIFHPQKKGMGRSQVSPPARARETKEQ
jgi:hypothetical protein